MRLPTIQSSQPARLMLLLIALISLSALQIPAPMFSSGEYSGFPITEPSFPASVYGFGEMMEPDRQTKARIGEAYGKLPLVFEEASDRTDQKAEFFSRGKGYDLYLAPDEILLVMGRNQSKTDLSQTIGSERNPYDNPAIADVLRMKFVGADSSPNVEGIDRLPGKSNYLIGNDAEKWRVGISTYSKVKYNRLYPGIDAVFYGNRGQLEYDFIVEPGADAGAIKLSFEGASRIRIENGDLVLGTALGEIRQHKPIVYQEKNGVKEVVAGQYVFDGEQEVKFQVGSYDKSELLIIDPVLSYSTYLGGSGFEQAEDIAVDFQGNAYVTGFTWSANFPLMIPFQSDFRGGPADAFVVKLNSTGSALIYSTYLGGTGDDLGTGIAVDSSGNCYITGFTSSSNFPTTQDAFQGTLGGGFDIFVSKLNSSGTEFTYSTYLGGTDIELYSDISVQLSGDAFITGSTMSSDFPVVNPLQANSGGGVDVFIARFDPTGSLIFSTYMGGSGVDRGRGIVNDSSGNCYITGSTSSANFPTTAGSFQTTFRGGGDECDSFLCGDAFVAKLNSSGSVLIYSTYIGGKRDDEGTAIAIDSCNNAYLTGSTYSRNFPTTTGAYQETYRGGEGGIGGDAFVTKLNPEGTALVYSSYLGGRNGELALGIAVDSPGNAHITGITESPDFPTKDALQRNYGGGFFEAFITKIDSTGSSVEYSTFMGGSETDVGAGIVTDLFGNAYVSGDTSSPGFPLMNPIQPVLTNSLNDIFISKIAMVASEESESGSAPTLTSLMILKKGNVVDHLISRKKTKKYRLTISGSGFTENTQLFVNGEQARILNVSSNELTARLPPGRAGCPGMWFVQARNSNGPISNVLTIEIRSN